jgi:cell division protein FtsI (penicillin-binding protein 3)
MNTVRQRIFVLGGIVTLLISCVVVRLFMVQVVDGRKYALQSKRQSQSRTVVAAHRGAIRDRHGSVLATSIASQLTIDKTLLDTHALAVYTLAGKSSGLSGSRRIYPYGEVAGALLGYIGKEGDGLGGIEYMFDKELRGEDGWKILRKDGRNKRYSRDDMPGKTPRNGDDIWLTLDLDIQRIAENVLKQTVARLGARGGMCVIMDPLGGDILAMVNEPGFNPNIAAVYSLQARANGCVSGNFEPGSTYKVITASGALQENVISVDDTIDGNHGIYKIYSETITDEKPFDRLSFGQALWYSSNVCFAKIATKLGPEKLYKYTKDFGLGARSGVALPGDECGIVHPVESWSGRTLVTMAIGQEVSVTLIQMMNVFGAIANNGVLMAPRICLKVASDDGDRVTPTEPKFVRRVVSEQVAARMRELLIGVVAVGTGKKAAVPGVAVAGKTGTSQKVNPQTGAYYADRYCSSFIGFAPARNPVLLVGVVIDEPANGESGGAAAAPAFRQIVNQIISHPQMQYAERILHTVTDTAGHRNPQDPQMPAVCGLTRAAAEVRLQAAGLDCEWVGDGLTVTEQKPAAGQRMAAGGRGVLYAAVNRTGAGGAVAVIVPRCVGIDLRDAVNAVRCRGLVPIVKGMGIVRRQVPPAGASAVGGAICTLYGSLDG